MIESNSERIDINMIPSDNDYNIYQSHGFNDSKKCSKHVKKILYRPLIIAQAFFIFTIILYEFGPVEYYNPSPVLFYLFITLYQLAFCFGYYLQITKIRYLPTYYSTDRSLNQDKVIKFVQMIITLSLFLTTLNTIRNLGLSSLSLTTLVNKAIDGIMNPASMYNQSFKTANVFGGSYITYLIVLLSPLTWPAFCLSFYFFKKLSFSYKVATILLFFMEAVRWIAEGRNKGVFDIAIIVSTTIFVKILQNKYDDYLLTNKIKVSRKWISYLIVLVLLGVALSYFSNAINARVGGLWTGFNDNSILMKICPSFLKPTLIYITVYLCQGYYAFSYIFSTKWVPMFGVGNSMFLIANFSDLLGTDLYQYTYQTRMAEFGIKPYANWHSLYTWLANDVHYIGVIIVMFILGGYFAYVVKRCVIYKDLISYPMLAMLFIVIFYLPGNNQLLQHPHTFMAFWVLTIYWWMIRKKVFKKSIWGSYSGR